METQHATARHTLFYDGACGLCRRAVEAIRRRNPTEPIRFIDVNDDQAMQSFPQIDRHEAMERVTLLRADDEQRAGYAAVTAVIALLPRWRRFHPLFRLWPARALGSVAYSLVGRNRYAISDLFGWD